MPLLSHPRLPRYKKLEDLLEKSFSLVKMPSLQPVVMCVMKHLPKVSTAGQQGSVDPGGFPSRLPRGCVTSGLGCGPLSGKELCPFSMAACTCGAGVATGAFSWGWV